MEYLRPGVYIEGVTYKEGGIKEKEGQEKLYEPLPQDELPQVIDAGYFGEPKLEKTIDAGYFGHPKTEEPIDGGGFKHVTND